MSLNLAKYKILIVDDVREMRMSSTSLTELPNFSATEIVVVEFRSPTVVF